VVLRPVSWREACPGRCDAAGGCLGWRTMQQPGEFDAPLFL